MVYFSRCLKMNIEQKVKKIDLPVKYTTISIFTMKTSVACALSRGFSQPVKTYTRKLLWKWECAWNSIYWGCLLREGSLTEREFVCERGRAQAFPSSFMKMENLVKKWLRRKSLMGFRWTGKDIKINLNLNSNTKTPLNTPYRPSTQGQSHNPDWELTLIKRKNQW